MTEEQEFINQLHEVYAYFPMTGKLIRRRSMGGRGNNQYPAGSEVGSVDSRGYLQTTLRGKTLKVHRLCFALANGYMPKEIDHINRNKADNRLVNLREVTKKQNQHNKGLQKNNTSGCIGVWWYKKANKWRVQLHDEFSKLKSHGLFTDFNDACQVARAEKDRVDKALGI